MRQRREPGEAFAPQAPDPSRISGVAEAPFARLPDPSTLFAARAARFRFLAEGHVLAPYLAFLARVVAAQAGAVAALPPPQGLDPARLAVSAGHGMPPLAGIALAEDFMATLAWLLDHLDLADAPEAARLAVGSLRFMADDERLALAGSVMEGGYPLDLVAEALFVAAALQVHLARLTRQLAAAALQPAADGVCPACGGAPVSSLVVGWTAASKARYCACSLCGTLWNHVRIKCTACGATDGIAYHTVEGGSKTVGVETCTTCRSYIKHLQQHAEPGLDPVADDVACYALDLLVREQGFRRSGLNPLFLQG